MTERSPEDRRAVAEFLIELWEMAAGEGRHAGHELEQAGRCAYCSCGARLGQGDARRLREAARQGGRPGGD